MRKVWFILLALCSCQGCEVEGWEVKTCYEYCEKNNSDVDVYENTPGSVRMMRCVCADGCSVIIDTYDREVPENKCM